MGRATILKSVLKYDDPVDAMFHALADGNRRAIVERLSRGSASVTELAGILAVTLAAVMQHVRVLEKSGLVRTQKIGRVRSASLEPEAFGTVERWITERRTTWERRLDRLGVFLAETGDEK